MKIERYRELEKVLEPAQMAIVDLIVELNSSTQRIASALENIHKELKIQEEAIRVPSA